MATPLPPSELARRARARIAALPSSSTGQEGSQIQLMREHLRRMALWANALECVDDWPWFGVAAELAARSDAVKTALGEAQLDQLAPLPLAGIAGRICSHYLAWSAIAELLEVRRHGLADPYEPAILLFQRGGYPTVEHGMFHIGLAGFPLGKVATWIGKPPVVELDEASLAAADEQWRAELASR